MTAAVLSIGTELTRGELVNTNATWLAERLTLSGFEVEEIVTVDDDVARIAKVLARLGQTHRVVVSTGGLGPTTDDLTAEAVARALGISLIRHEPSYDAIKQRLATFGREMSITNAKQADLPDGSDVLPNAMGTAPGFGVKVGTARAFFLPGVPSEMRHMFEERVAPAIAELATRTSHLVRVRTFGLPESQIGERLAGIEESEPGITIGYRASFPEVEVKVLARAPHHAEAEALGERVAQVVRDRLPDAAYGDGEETFPAYLGRTLRDRGLTLAVAESCTGGMIGELVTRVPGSSDYLLLDAVTYSNAAKTDLLGVGADLLRAYGAVSSEVSCAMAEGALRRAESDIAVAVTGIAGPGGATETKPVGTVWFGLAQKDRETTTRTLKLPGDRERIRTLASYIALKMVVEAARSTGR